jgi:5'-nucleotidase
MNKCVLLIDLDGVVTNWVKGVKHRFETRNPDKKLPPISEFKQYYLQDAYPQWETELSEVMFEKGLYSSLEPIEGAIDSLKDIEHNCLDFIDPFICSSPDTAYEDQLCHSEKASWVLHHLGKFWVDRMILSRDKTIVRGSILIDDKPHIKGSLFPVWKHLVYEASYNEEEYGDLRFSWKDWPLFRDEALKPLYLKSSIIIPSEFTTNILKGNLYEYNS